jgi:hypothetical protein|tara:strand:- start:26 stop:565 length:540 start_codon:yes stop_codon:yes gene_type:complete
MTYQSRNPIVLEAIEKAWENSKTQKQAAEKYLNMLRNDKELRDAATARYLQRIASEDVSARSRTNRISFKRQAEKISKQVLLKKGEHSTPNVSLKNTAVNYAKNIFDYFALPDLGIALGDATKADLEHVVKREHGKMNTHKRNHKFLSAILEKMPEGKIVRDVWKIEDVEAIHTDVMVS